VIVTVKKRCRKCGAWLWVTPAGITILRPATRKTKALPGE
jgi:hypothetical protein